MLEAMYGIEFESNLNIAGYGVVILETGRILGGDSSFAYVGNYEVKNENIHVTVKCTNDRESLQSIFGDIKEFNLVLDGKPEHDGFVLQGHMVEKPEMQIALKLTRRAELP